MGVKEGKAWLWLVGWVAGRARELRRTAGGIIDGWDEEGELERVGSGYRRGIHIHILVILLYFNLMRSL